MTFRRRLLLASLLTLVVGMGALLVTGNVLLDRRVASEASSLLRARTEATLATLSVGPSGIDIREAANDDTLDRQAWVLESGRVIERPAGVDPALDRAAVALGHRGGTGERDVPGEIRLRTEPVPGADGSPAVGSVVVGLSVHSLEQLEQQVLLGSLVIAALLLVAGAFAIRSALDGALRPVAEMTSAAQDWSAHDLERRFDLGPPRDELTALAATLDGLLARIAASRRHEQRFASEMAHELRTPLAGLLGRAELALAATAEDPDADREQALRVVVAQAKRLQHTIDALLAVARQELDPTEGTVDLAALAREFEDVELLPPPTPVPNGEGEPDVARRALAPLVDNARRHADTRVWFELSASDGRARLAVHDDGPGIDTELGGRVFEPGVRGAGSGAGLGLPLARRLARSCGGEIRLGDGPGGCFIFELPALDAPLR